MLLSLTSMAGRASCVPLAYIIKLASTIYIYIYIYNIISRMLAIYSIHACDMCMHAMINLYCAVEFVSVIEKHRDPLLSSTIEVETRVHLCD